MISVRGLEVDLFARAGMVPVLQGVELTLQHGRALAVIGPSGAGKSTLLFALLGLLPRGRARIRGSIEIEGREVVGRSEAELSRLRGARVAIVPQEPGAALDPRMTIGAQVAEAAALSVGARAAKARAEAGLEEVGFEDPRASYQAYPHQLSGGMRQRAVIAMALARDPAALLLDEPSSSLDALSRVALASMLEARRRARGLTLLLVTHDLALASRLGDDLAVLDDGRIIEVGPKLTVLHAPVEPRTRVIIQAGRRLAGLRRASIEVTP